MASAWPDLARAPAVPEPGWEACCPVAGLHAHSPGFPPPWVWATVQQEHCPQAKGLPGVRAPLRTPGRALAPDLDWAKCLRAFSRQAGHSPRALRSLEVHLVQKRVSPGSCPGASKLLLAQQLPDRTCCPTRAPLLPPLQQVCRCPALLPALPQSQPSNLRGGAPLAAGPLLSGLSLLQSPPGCTA